MRLLLLVPAVLSALAPARLAAQDDPNDVPLGDVARAMRKTASGSSKQVIDDDNLPQVMEQATSHHAQGSALRFLMDGASNGFRISAPDVTCSLAFTANVKSLLSNQYSEMVLPPADVLRLEGPATIEGGALILALYNNTDWHVSELSVALTVVKKPETREASLSIEEAPYGMSSHALLSTTSTGASAKDSEPSVEKRPDVTVIYRMRAAAAPSATTVFSASLNAPLAPDEEWHWAIVQAKGYPPQKYNQQAVETTSQSASPAVAAPLRPAPTAAGSGNSTPASAPPPPQ